MGVPLPPIPTAESVTASLPPEIFTGLGAGIDAWAEAIDWRDRMALADTLLLHWVAVPATRWRVQAGCRLLTAMLEQLGERDIGTGEAAAMYRVAEHLPWRLAACRWLESAGDQALAAFMDAHPAWTVFASQAAVLHG